VQVLSELVVENYAVVDRLRVRFHKGLNLVTGETGSGKSIVVDSLGLLLGGRASADMIRSGESRARVSGIFEGNAGVSAVLAQAGLEGEDEDILIEREILSSGKSRAWVNSRPATVALLRDIGIHLGDIHGQHDQQLLFDPAAQLSMLDSFAGAPAERIPVTALFKSWRDVTAKIVALESSDRDQARLLDLWQFQRKEIDAAELRPGEDVELEAERRVQQHAGRLLESAGAAFEALYDSPDSALAHLRAAAKRLDEVSKIDETMVPVRQSLEPAMIAAQDVAYSLRDYLGRVEANPARLEEIESRLAGIEKLKRKYGNTVDGILAFREDVAAKIGDIENSDERLTTLREEQTRLAAQFEAAAGKLTAKRSASAKALSRKVEEELRPLAMERAVFRVGMEAAPWSETGADAVRFLVSANAGEEPRPLEAVASGGELSRIALALKTCLAGPARAGVQRTLVFDEIDTGIGGRAAEGVARRLKALAAENQVICVTHLAQIACFAEHHYRVEKLERDGRTVAGIEELDAAMSTEEVGRMLSGQRLTTEALKNAEQLIRSARATL